MSLDDIQGMLQYGIEAAQNQNNIIARSYLRQVIEADRDNELAWMWLTQCVDTAQERKECLQQVLRINPNNQKARIALDKILEKESARSSRDPSTSTQDSSTSLAALRRAATPAPEPAAQSPQAGGAQRNYLEPIERRDLPRELWSSQRGEGIGWTQLLIFGAVAGIALIIIVVAGLSLADQLEEEDSSSSSAPTPTQSIANTTPTITLTASPTLRPGSVEITGVPNEFLNITLPPTFTPTPTNTPSATPTSTATLPPSNTYQIIYSADDFVGNPKQIYTSLANGENRRALVISLPESAFVVPTPIPTDTPESPTADATSEPTEEPTPTPLQDVIVEFTDPVYSPNGMEIAFIGQVNNRQELYVISAADPTNIRALTSFNAQAEPEQIISVESPSWSPDGTTIIFASDADGDFEIYRVAADGSTPPVFLTNNRTNERYPVWSPDGNYYAYASDADSPGQFQVYVASLRASVDNPPCPLITGSGQSFSPAWSPDGKYLAYISTARGDNDLYIIRLDGLTANGVLITENDFTAIERDPAWSPDGNWIILSSNRTNSDILSATAELWMVNPNRTPYEWRLVSTTEGDERYPQWFPQQGELLPDIGFLCPR